YLGQDETGGRRKREASGVDRDHGSQQRGDVFAAAGMGGALGEDVGRDGDDAAAGAQDAAFGDQPLAHGGREQVDLHFGGNDLGALGQGGQRRITRSAV